MFFELVSRNSKRSQKENRLFFASLLVSIVAFYIILSLSQQDVMRFLQEMESDAVSRLLSMIPVFFGMTLVILFFLIYFASKFQLERRRHECGMYLMLGMRRYKLFALLLAEDLRSSLLALLAGLPTAILLSELISLITARLVGLGIIGHQFSLSVHAVLWTTAGFLVIKLAAFLILSGKISRQELGSLLMETPEGAKKERSRAVYAWALLLGALCLGCAYFLAISGVSWRNILYMGLTMLLGGAGTALLFYGMRSVMRFLIQAEKPARTLHLFNIRQVQENVIRQSGTMTVSSLLILAALCCFGVGVSVARFYGQSEAHVLDYTFRDATGHSAEGADEILETLAAYHLDDGFSRLFAMKIGHIRTHENTENAFAMPAVMDAIAALPPSQAQDVLLNNLSYTGNPRLISLSGYNTLLQLAGLPSLTLSDQEAAVYIDASFTTEEQTQILNAIVADRPAAQLEGATCFLTGPIQSTRLVTDRSITLSFALIVPDAVFDFYTQDQYDVYLNGVLSSAATDGVSLMTAIFEMNEALDGAGLSYESYLQNMGRQLFYVVATSYITIYLAIIFLIVANTVIGVQFLMHQQKTSRRYKTLARLGATYEALCQSAKQQINWYFGIPTIVAVISSLFGVRALFSGLLPTEAQHDLAALLTIAGAMILVLCVIEYIYISAVKRTSSRYLLTLMMPQREE